MSHRQAVYRHNAPTEVGREEVFIDEWRRRYGEPTRADVADARIATPAEDRAIINGQLPAWSQRGPVHPGSRPRLVMTDNPRARRRPVRGGRIPKRRGGRASNVIYPFERVHYIPSGQEVADDASAVSDEDYDEDGEEEYFDDGENHNRQDPQRRDEFDEGGGGGGYGAGPPMKTA